MIPSEEEALALHRKYGSSETIISHCRVVTKVALTIAEELRRKGRQVDVDVVRSAALLHDIGRSRTQTVKHGVEGADMLRSEGVDDRVVRAVRSHVGAGISKEETTRLGFPEHDCVPRSIEERTVCFADKMVGSDRVKTFEDEVSRFVRKGHDVARLRALKEGLQDDLGTDPETLVLNNLKESQ